MTEITHLQALGFSGYEAKAYVALLRLDVGNGYEIAKAAGIPRANVYAVLDRLVARGAATEVTTPEGKRYRATPARLLLQRLELQHQQQLAAAEAALAQVHAASAGSAPVVQLQGEDTLLANARELIDSSRKELLVAIQPSEAAQLAAPLRAAAERKVTITTLCLEACARECGGCRGYIRRLPLAPPGGMRWLLLVADDATALVGQLRGDAVHGLRTQQPLIIALAGAYIRQSLALTLLGNELAGQFDGLLSAQARELLHHLIPEPAFPGFAANPEAAAASFRDALVPHPPGETK